MWLPTFYCTLNTHYRIVSVLHRNGSWHIGHQSTTFNTNYSKVLPSSVQVLQAPCSAQCFLNAGDERPWKRTTVVVYHQASHSHQASRSLYHTIQAASHIYMHSRMSTDLVCELLCSANIAGNRHKSLTESNTDGYRYIFGEWRQRVTAWSLNLYHLNCNIVF